MTITAITDKMTPAEIDTILVDAMWEKAKATNSQTSAENAMEGTKHQLVTINEILGYPTLSESDTRYYTKQKAQKEAKIVSFTERIAETRQIIAETSEQCNLCDAEYAKRGGWTRFWIVVNSNGHIHTSRSCTTCFPTTQYAWLPDLSGSTNDEVVELAGESACTICFPDAPVDTRNRPSRIEEPARKAAREERERKAAEKARKAQEKGITAPNGGELKIKGSWSTIKTAAEAQRLYVNARVSLLLHETKHYVIQNPHYLEQLKENAATLLPALAAKRGTTENEEREALEKKVLAKIKREWKITL